MRLTVFAATGGIGRHVVEQATAAGHDVTAVIRDPARLAADARTVAADLHAPDPVAIQDAVRGADAVLSCLGARTKADIGVAATGTGAIVAAMHATSVRRLVVVSAAPIGTVPSANRPTPPRHDPGDAFVMRRLVAPVLKTLLEARYADLAAMEDTVRDSGLDWTIVRPPRLLDRPLSGRYRTARGRNVRGGSSISRADVAHLMLRVVDEPETIKEVISLAY